MSAPGLAHDGPQSPGLEAAHRGVEEHTTKEGCGYAVRRYGTAIRLNETGICRGGKATCVFMRKNSQAAEPKRMGRVKGCVPVYQTPCSQQEKHILGSGACGASVTGRLPLTRPRRVQQVSECGVAAPVFHHRPQRCCGRGGWAGRAGDGVMCLSPRWGEPALIPALAQAMIPSPHKYKHELHCGSCQER